MPTKTEFPIVFEKLKSIIKPYSSKQKLKAENVPKVVIRSAIYSK